jgi:large subunit ribosomal protein L30
MSKKLKIQQVKSIIGKLEAHKRTIRALGLHRIRHTVIHDDTPAIRGMVEKVKHLVTVEKIDGE